MLGRKQNRKRDKKEREKEENTEKARQYDVKKKIQIVREKV